MTTKDLTRKMPDAQPAQPTEWGEYTDQGPREDNQDRVLSVNRDNPRIARKGVLLIVCDGVGGEEGGQIASQTASLTAYDAYYNDQTDEDIEAALRQAVHQANLAVKARAAANPKQKTMATTIVMTVVAGDKLRVAHVGDSRAYLVRRGAIQQLSNDHNWVSERMRDGSMTREQAKTSTFKTTLTRSLGGSNRNEPDISAEIPLLPGDRVMLCSDGVHGSVSESEMLHILGRVADPNKASEELVATAKANKTSDNVTAAVLNYGAPAIAGAGGNIGGRKILPLLISAVALLVGLGVVAWVVMGGSVRSTVGSTPTPTYTITIAGRTAVTTTLAPTAITATIAPIPITTSSVATTTITSTVAASAATPTIGTPTPVEATSTLAPTAPPTNTPKPPTRTPIPTRTPVPSVTPIRPTDAPKQEAPSVNPQPEPPKPEPPKPEPPKPEPCVPAPGKQCP